MKYQFYIIVFTIGILLLGGGVYFASQVGAQSAPAVPSDFEVKAVSACKLKVNWTYGDVEGIVFEARRKKGSGGAYFESIPNSNIKGSYYFTDSNKDTLWEGEDDTIPIDPEKNYSYRLRAHNETAETYSNYTDFAEATTEPLPRKPGKPVNLDVREENGNAYVSWQVNQPISPLFNKYGKFEIWHATSSDGKNYSDLKYLDEIRSKHYEKVGGEEKYFYDYQVDKDLSHRYVIYTKEVGGEGCNPNREEHTVLSDGSSPVILPARPYDLDTESIERPKRKIILTWSDRSAETEFKIQRSLTRSFDSPEPYSVSANQTEYNDTNIIKTGPGMYWYRIRSCIGNNCSFFTKPVSGTIGVPVPQNVKARIVYVSGEKSGGAKVNLSWEEEELGSDSKLRIERAVGKGDFDENNPVAVIPTLVPARDKSSYTFTEPSLGGTYRYRIINVAGNGAESAPSDPPAVINLDTSRILQGVAWTAGEDSEGNLHGIGWVKFNSLKENGTGSTSNLYSVQIHDDGVLSGLAWAGEKYGWLSFNKADLEGCPTGTSCEAQIDSNGKLNGWARFLSPLSSEGNGNWNGWVHLRNDEEGYGVKMENNNYFSGAAWGGDVAGWIVFGGSDCSDCTVMAMVNTCDPNDLSAIEESSNEIRIDWTNADYDCEDGISLYRSPADQPGVGRNQFSEEVVFPSGNYHSGLGDVSYTDGGLEKDTTYAYFVKESALGNESNIGSAKTPKADYDITCQARNNEEINVFWTGDVLSGYTVELFGGKKETFKEIYSANSGDGSFTHGGLDSDTEYNYELRIYDAGSSRDKSVEPDSQPVYCTTAAVSSDMPTELSVLPLSSSTLHVTWKDNAATEHDFELGRIKLTPDTPDQLEVAAGGSSIDLNWVNTTNDNTYKGPFYHVVERTEDIDGNGDPDFGGSSFTTSTEAGSTDYDDTATDFSFTDNGTSGNAYYYRVKACSYIEADFSRDGNDNPLMDCSDYSSVESDTVAAGKKKNWYGNIIEAIKSFFSSLRDKSESMIERMETASATGIDINEYFNQFEKDLTFKNNPGVYDDLGLDADSAYLYRVKAVFGSGGSAYSKTGAGKTLSAGNETPFTINICTGNSFCEPVTGTETDGGDRDLQNQCSNNADCRDVGTSRKVFEETK